MSYYAVILIAGFIGGVLRGLVGYIKYYTRFKAVKFRWRYFLGMTGLSAVIGLLSAWAAQDIGITFLNLPVITPAIAFIIGYAGGDFIENIFKIFTKKNAFFKLPEQI